MQDAILTLLAAPQALGVVALLCVLLLDRTGVLAPLSARPGLVLAAGLAVGLSYRALGLPGMEPEALREAARIGLALLAFLAALQCRLSRLPRASVPALRLITLGLPGYALASFAAVYALLPSLGLWSALMVGAVLPLGPGGFDERRALAAPLSADTKRAVRLDAAMGVAIGVPIALIVEAVSIPPVEGMAIGEMRWFALFAGAAVGGTVGLLVGRMLPVGGAGTPKAPLLALVLAYGLTRVIGYDAVMASVACGLLYAEEAPLPGAARSRLYAAGVRWCVPTSLFALAAVIWPASLSADLLVWLAALVPVLALRGIVRAAALGGASLAQADRSFLAWFGGVPGAGAALFVLSLAASPSEAIQADALTVAALGTGAGVIVARLASGPLVTRQVRAAARARRRRYGTT